MKITGSTSAGSLTGSGGGSRAVAPGFAPASGAPAQAAASSHIGSVSSLGSVDALLALQEAGGPLERRRRAVKRAGRILDVLDDLKLSLLDDSDGGGAALQRLQTAVREARDGTDDPRLEGVLDEIETRAAVELAKQEMSRAA